MEGNRTVLKQSDNIFQDILSPLTERGTFTDVYFYRIIGCDDERQFLREIFNLDERLRTLGNYSCFDKAIPIANDLSIIEQAKRLINQVPLKDYTNGAILNVLETQGYFEVTLDLKVNQKIKDAFGIVLNLYMTNERTVNISIAENFITKILLWFVEYGKQIGKKSLYNPKIIYWGSPKTHEIYFLILMSLLGCDVLVLNTTFNDRFINVDKRNEFSILIKKQRELPIGDFPAQKIAKDPQIRTVQPQIRSEQLSNSEKIAVRDPLINRKNAIIGNDHLVTKLKQSESIFEEILVPMNKRSGYVGEPYPILPVFFLRFIGVPGSTDDWEAEYYNSLYNLDKAFQTLGYYFKFTESIPTPSAMESALLPPGFSSYRYKDWFEILEQILQAKILPRSQDVLLDNTIRKSFVDTVSLFVEKSSNVNTSIVLNFSLKLVAWFNRYLPKLFLNSNSNQKSDIGLNYEHNPKILFYSAIKPHEIYLLYAFHKLGCDVLFIHPDPEGDKTFQLFDKDKLLTQLVNNTHNLPFVSFPETEQLIRKSTIAYNASKEIEEVIYSEEVGLFKPWQFESYLTQPITLKTTYEELKILWREPSKLRPEFKVQNKKVYVPNMFAKINGVNESIDTYWQDLKTLSCPPNTRLIEDLPFTELSYTKQELYQADFLLNDQGLFDELKVQKSKHYKFDHLKINLQHFLIIKINELLFSGMFLATVDEKFKLKILMTILTMDDSLLRLIEVFDFPQEIPKIIVFDNKKETFSEADAILLAYFYLIGFDIVIFTPTNYKTIEQYIKPSLFNVHQLPLVKYELALPSLSNISATSDPKPGLLSRFFHRRQ